MKKKTQSWLEIPHRPFSLNLKTFLVKPINYKLLFLELTFSKNKKKLYILVGWF